MVGACHRLIHQMDAAPLIPQPSQVFQPPALVFDPPLARRVRQRLRELRCLILYFGAPVSSPSLDPRYPCSAFGFTLVPGPPNGTTSFAAVEEVCAHEALLLKCYADYQRLVWCHEGDISTGHVPADTTHLVGGSQPVLSHWVIHPSGHPPIDACGAQVRTFIDSFLEVGLDLQERRNLQFIAQSAHTQRRVEQYPYVGVSMRPQCVAQLDQAFYLMDWLEQLECRLVAGGWRPK